MKITLSIIFSKQSPLSKAGLFKNLNLNIMRKSIFILILLLNTTLSAQSFNFLDRQIVYGSSPEVFLEKFPEFKIDPQLTSDGQTSAIYLSNIGSCEISYTVQFENSSLSVFRLSSNCTMGEDNSIIESILKQFKFIPSKNSDDEEMGDVVETYKKGKLTATAFIGGFFILTIFKSK